jgi:hypothetical protein
MSIFNGGNFSKPFNVSQPELNSSDRTANLKSKTIYSAAVNLAKNGGVLTKTNGSQFVGPVQTTSTFMTSASSYADLLHVSKGKYLLTPPPSSDLATLFSPANGDVYYGNFTITDYYADNLAVTALGYPTVTWASIPGQYAYPNQLVKTPNPTPNAFNSSNIVVDPEYRLFYGQGTCSTRTYFKNVRVDPSVDVTWTADGIGGEVFSSRPYNEQQAQRIIAHQMQNLRGFQYPVRINLNLENCESRPSITPVAPDAPVIYLESISGTGPYTVTITWLHGFDGGSPISTYTLHNGGSIPIPLKPCLNTWTGTVSAGTQIWVTASNCVPKERWSGGTIIQKCTTLTSVPSNTITVPVI